MRRNTMSMNKPFMLCLLTLTIGIFLQPALAKDDGKQAKNTTIIPGSSLAKARIGVLKQLVQAYEENKDYKNAIKIQEEIINLSADKYDKAFASYNIALYLYNQKQYNYLLLFPLDYI